MQAEPPESSPEPPQSPPLTPVFSISVPSDQDPPVLYPLESPPVFEVSPSPPPYSSLAMEQEPPLYRDPKVTYNIEIETL